MDNVILQVWHSASSEIINVVVLLIVALLVQVIRWAGLAVTANTEAQLETYASRAINATREEAARRDVAGTPMSSREKAQYAALYVMQQYDMKKTILSSALALVFRAWRGPTADKVHAVIDSLLTAHGEGAAVASVSPKQ